MGPDLCVEKGTSIEDLFCMSETKSVRTCVCVASALDYHMNSCGF